MPENIELQELLNRKTGPGRISPQTPLEARLYGPDGQPLGTQSNPLEARVRELEAELQELRQTLTSGDAKVQLTGSVVPDEQAMPVRLMGHIQEFAVSSWDEIAPDEVPVGSVAILIGTNDIRQTDGEVWLPI